MDFRDIVARSRPIEEFQKTLQVKTEEESVKVLPSYEKKAFLKTRKYYGINVASRAAAMRMSLTSKLLATCSEPNFTFDTIKEVAGDNFARRARPTYLAVDVFYGWGAFMMQMTGTPNLSREQALFGLLGEHLDAIWSTECWKTVKKVHIIISGRSEGMLEKYKQLWLNRFSMLADDITETTEASGMHNASVEVVAI